MMGNFKSNNSNRQDNRSSGNPRSRFGGQNRNSRPNFGNRDSNKSRGGFNGRDRNSGRQGRRREMFNVVCDKCGKDCQVPFKPSGNKPVLCSNCFSKDDGSSNQSNSPQSGMSSEQFDKLNKKLDRILKVLEDLEIEYEDDEEEAEEDKAEITAEDKESKVE